MSGSDAIASSVEGSRVPENPDSLWLAHTSANSQPPANPDSIANIPSPGDPGVSLQTPATSNSPQSSATYNAAHLHDAVQTQLTNESSHDANQPPRGESLPEVVEGEKDEEPQHAEQLLDYRTVVQDKERQLEEQRTRLRKTKRTFHITLAATCLALFAIILPLSILYGKQKSRPPAVQAPTNTLTVSTLSYADVLPIADAGLGATTVVLGDIFAPPSPTGNQTDVVYHGDNGRICVRPKTNSTWHTNVQCVEGANPLPNSPIAALDWLGGPSIYFFTENHTLSGIDHIPQNDTWRLSSVINYNALVHNLSQIASATWLHGRSAWIYYQDRNEQIRALGLDDYRDPAWRDSSVGPLGLAQVGSGIGAIHWVNGSKEVEEIFFQQGSGVITGRMYANEAWTPDLYAIEGTQDSVPKGASIAATTIVDGAGSGTVLLAYIATSGFLSVQARATIGQSTSMMGAFSPRVEIVEGDGHARCGIAAVGSLGQPRVYFQSTQKILEATSESAWSGNWTTTAI